MFFMSTTHYTQSTRFQFKNSMMQRRERGKRQLSQTITPLIIILASILYYILLYFIICIDVFFPFPKDFYYWLAATL